MRFFDEIRDNSGYYYIHEKINLNDFVLMIAYVFLMVGLYVVYIIYPGREEWESFDMTMTILVVGFSIPFVAHFTDRAVKFLGFRLKKAKILKNGYPYRAKLVESKQGKILYKDSMLNIKRYCYYPVIDAYINGEYQTLTSKLPISNSHEMGLKDKTVTVMVYKDEFIFLDFSPSDDGIMNLDYIEFKNKTDYNKYKKLEYMWTMVVLASVALFHVVLMAIKIALKYFM